MGQGCDGRNTGRWTGYKSSGLILSVIHERDFKTSTTYPFACFFFQLRMDAGVRIWHYDTLRSPAGTVYIGLIRDDANVVASCRGPSIEVSPLRDKLEETMDLA